MKNSLFNYRFTGILLIMGAVMVSLGFLFRPVQLQDSFDLPAFLHAHEHEGIWIWSFRILVFGLFIQVMGLTALKTLFRQLDGGVIISSGIMVCILALLVAALSEGYYMHMGAWGGWKASTLEPAAQNAFLLTLEPTHEWVICLNRMWYMFFCMGLAAVGWGMWRSMFLSKWLAIYALLWGMAGIAVMMVFDKRTDIFIPVRWGISAFFLMSGILLLNKKSEE